MSTATPVEGHYRTHQSDFQNADVIRVAIVGCGPRGLQCLIELNQQLDRSQTTAPISITIFEPCEFLGAGVVYDPRQPSYLKMNFAAKHISAWRRTNDNTDSSRSLVGWLESHGHSGDLSETFVPRSDVGSYLHSCFIEVIERLREKVSVKVIHKKVTTIVPDTSGKQAWQLSTADGIFPFDEVVVTLGHEGWRQQMNQASRFPLSPAFPVQSQLSEAKIRPAAKVAVRGFGLTFIDTALSLTEGRGGVFEEYAGGWRYLSSGREPDKILPFSRTGRPMLSKPDEGRCLQPSQLEEIWATGRLRISEVKKPIDKQRLINHVWRSVTDAAAKAANHFNGDHAGELTRQVWTAQLVEDWFQKVASKVSGGKSSYFRMMQSWKVATGKQVPDIEWALAAAWRGLYPALVDAISHAGLAATAWPEFKLLATEMERIAFGPSAENMGKLLALIDAEIVDLDFLNGRVVAPSAESQQLWITNRTDAVAIAAVVDAVIPSATENCPLGPLQGLLKAGTIHRLHNTHGIHVNREGRPIDRSGQVIDGMAIIGRATEGCVLGNDSLSRSLHDHPRQWARSVVQNLHQQVASL